MAYKTKQEITSLNMMKYKSLNQDPKSDYIRVGDYKYDQFRTMERCYEDVEDLLQQEWI